MQKSSKSTNQISPTNLSRMVAAPKPHDNDNPLWAGPCGEGPLGGITQSMLGRFLSCRERFRLRYVCGLEPHDKWNHRLGYGNMWHVCEEALAAKVDWELVLLNYAKKQCERYPLQVQEITKWYNVCKVQFPEYIEYWADHPDVQNRTPLMQEQVFDVPYQLPSGRKVRLRGRFDSVDLITDEVNPHGGIYLQENKTKSDIDKLQVERQLKFDLQTMMYTIALQEYKDHVWDCDLYDPKPGHTHQVCGVRYNVVRRPLSGGKGNIKPHAAKYTKTKVIPAETDEQFYERLRRDYIAAEPDYWFFRVRAEIAPRDVEVFKQTCLDPILEQLCDWYQSICGRGQVNPYSESYVNYRTPFGIFNSLSEGGATEYDAMLTTGSEIGLRRTEELFTELQ